MTAVIDQWQDLTGDLPDEDVLDEIVDIDDDDQDYSVRTKHTFATNPWVKIGFFSGATILAVLLLSGFLWGIGAFSSGNVAEEQPQNSGDEANPDPLMASNLSQDEREMLKGMMEKDTFDRQRNRQQILNGKQPPNQTKGQQQKPVPATPQRTVTAPRVIYRERPAQQRSHASYQQANHRQFTVQRPVAVATQPVEQVDDPNAGYFTAPVASSNSSSSGKRKLLKLTKSDGFKANKTPIKRFTPPVQVASTAQTIPQPQKSFGNLSGNLQHPYMNQIVATAGRSTVPVDTAINAQVINRVSWIPENPGLAKGKVVRLKLQDDLKDGAGDVIASQGTIALGIVTQATEQGLISVNLTKIGSKFVQSGAVEIHQDGDPTMIAKLETKGGSNGFLKTALDIGIGGVQTWASNRNNPTSQTAISNGNQTFLSTNNNNRNNTAAFVEGATGRIGERLRQSVEGPTQTKIGVFRFGGKRVQLYFVREVRL